MIIFSSESRTGIFFFFFLSFKITKLFHAGHMSGKKKKKKRKGKKDEGKFRVKKIGRIVGFGPSFF